MDKDKVEFDEFVKAVQAAGLSDADTTDGAADTTSVPLTHTSGVTPKDWERVQRSLADK